MLMAVTTVLAAEGEIVVKEILTIVAIACVVSIGAETAVSDTYTESFRPRLAPTGDASFDRGFRIGYGAGALDYEDCMLYVGSKYARRAASTWAVGLTTCRQWMLS
jgi:hypothetical protein